VAVAALPLYHIFSLTICCFAFLQLGAEGLLITNPRDINGLIKDLVQNHFTVFVGVNTLYQALLFNSKLKTVDFNQMKLALAGGMSVIHKVADRWQKATGKPIIMGYGLTEASPVVSINPLSVKEFTGSIGLPVPSTDIAILDEQGNEVPIGGEGELCVKGPQVMAGYWHQPEETALVLNESGWLRTGDLASMDEKGYIYLIDRKKDMILVSGFNVYPNEVEDVIASHPGVAEVAVVGVYNDISGEMVKAFIVKKDPNLTKQEIKQFCKQRLTGYKRPRIIEFRADLPKSNVGKVLRKDLRETN
jgi:long-chain acyl-CoA synthetase